MNCVSNERLRCCRSESDLGWSIGRAVGEQFAFSRAGSGHKNALLPESILHYAKVTGSRGLQPHSSCMRCIVGSRLAPGTPRYGHTPEIPDPEQENPEKSENPEKQENAFPACFALSRPNQGTYRHSRGIHGSGLT